MKRAFAISIMLALFAGCNTDIVTTKDLNKVKNKCVYISPIESQDPYVGKVLRDAIEKEFVRKGVQLCDANSANVILTGSTFLTTRSHGETSMLNIFGGKQDSAQSIESVTVSAKDSSGNLLLTASYNNADRLTASKLAQDLGSNLADKLK